MDHFFFLNFINDSMKTKSLAKKAVACKPVQCRGFSPTLLRSRLEKLLGALGQQFSVDLRLPSFLVDDFSLSNVKRFCGEPLNSPFGLSVPSSLGKSSRLSIAHSVFLFRKILPTPVPDVDAFALKMSKPASVARADFFVFLGKQIDRMFPWGWDREYTHLAISNHPSVTSCLESNRENYGARGMTTTGSWLSHAEYVERVLVGCSQPPRIDSKLAVVDTGGKKRIISVPSVDMNLLRPLHETLYNHLSKYPWLLRGDAKPSSFSDFTLQQDEVFVSGDYESATDNLDQDVQRFVLDRLLGTASIPYSIRDMAVRSLSMNVLPSFGGCSKGFRQRRGQMMGNLLSFPLLCLVNYLTFKYFVPRSVPVRVNGDDIVFRCRRDEFAVWKEGVGRCGLTLSLGKTMVDTSHFTLNSALFRARRFRVSTCRYIRSSSLWPREKERGVFGLSSRYRSFAVGFSGAGRDALRLLFLRENRVFLAESRRSLFCLGMPCSGKLLALAGLYDREVFYRSSVETPLPCPPSDAFWDVRVPGWVTRWVPRERKVHRQLSREHQGEVNHLLWECPVSESVERSEEAVFLWKSAPIYTRCSIKRVSRMLCLSEVNLRRRVARVGLPAVRPDFYRGWKLVWEKSPGVDGSPPSSLRSRPLRFVSST